LGKAGAAVVLNGRQPDEVASAATRLRDEGISAYDWLVARTPSRRWGEMEDLIGTAVFHASNASNFVNGQIIYVDGGVTASP
jgi:gluconate 5-dehydrogenase